MKKLDDILIQHKIHGHGRKTKYNLMSKIESNKRRAEDLATQSLILDFLSKVSESDKFVSMGFSTGLLFFTTFLFSSQFIGNLEKYVFYFRFAQGIAFIFFVYISSVHMIYLHQASMAMYKKVCLVQATRHNDLISQRLWVHISEYYTQNRKICYTWLGSFTMSYGSILKVSK